MQAKKDRIVGPDTLVTENAMVPNRMNGSDSSEFSSMCAVALTRGRKLINTYGHGLFPTMNGILISQLVIIFSLRLLIVGSNPTMRTSFP